MKQTALKILTLVLLALIIQGCGDTKSLPGENSVSKETLQPQTDLEGRIVFQSNMDGDNEIYLLSNKGLKQLTVNDWEDGFPAWAPDGKSIAFHANPQGRFDIFVMDSDGSNITPVTSSPQDETDPAWFPDGTSLSFTRDSKGLLRKKGTLFRVDVRTGRTKRLLPDFNGSHGIGHVSPKGTMLTLTGKRTMGWDVAVYDLGQNVLTFLEDAGKSCRARFSPDGESLAFVCSRADGKGDIWMMAPDGTGKTRLTLRDETYDYFPTWSPDGRFIAFNSSLQHDHDGDWQLFLFEVETGRSILLFDSPGNDIFPDWR